MRKMSSKKRKLLKYLQTNLLTNHDLNYMVRDSNDLTKNPSTRAAVSQVIKNYQKKIHFKAHRLIEIVYLDQDSIVYNYLQKAIQRDSKRDDFNSVAPQYISHFDPVQDSRAKLNGFLATEPYTSVTTIAYLFKPKYRNVYNTAHILRSLQDQKFIPSGEQISVNRNLLKYYQQLDRTANQQAAHQLGLDKIWYQE